MNARNLISKVAQTTGVTQGAILLAVQIILFVAVFCLIGQPALAKHKGHKKDRRARAPGRFCLGKGAPERNPPLFLLRGKGGAAAGLRKFHRQSGGPTRTE